MKKKLIRVSVIVIAVLILGVGGFLGWFFYQVRQMHPAETAKISDALFVVKGSICNIYLVKTGDGFVAFDAGDDPEKIAKGCKALSIDPLSVKAVFLTHSDADHVDGLPAFPKARVYLSSDEVPLLQDKSHRHFLGMGHQNRLPVSNYSVLSGGDAVDIGGLTVYAIATPGHTQGSMSYRAGDSLFTGDLCMIVNGLVQPMIGIFTEDMAMDAASIRKIAGLADFSRLCTAHSGCTENLAKALAAWRKKQGAGK